MKGLQGIARYIVGVRCCHALGILSCVGLIAIIVATVVPVYHVTDGAQAVTADETRSQITFTGVNSLATVNLSVASANGTFATSTDGTSNTTDQRASFNISTNYSFGYTLTIKSNNSHTTLKNGSNELSSISSATEGSVFGGTDASAQALNNKWGFLPNYYNSVANSSTYYPAPTTAGYVLRATSQANSGGADAYTIGLGVRADYGSPAGTYSFANHGTSGSNDGGYATFILEYVANTRGYAISYVDDTGEAENMPSATVGDMATEQGDQGYDGDNQQNPTRGISGVVLSDVVPTRAGYDFVGWCSVATTDSGEKCEGVVYDAGGLYDVKNIVSGAATLHAVWEDNSFVITYRANGGTGDDYTQKLAGSHGSALLMGNHFVRDNYYFMGWSTESDGVVQYRAGQEIIYDNDFDNLILYAVWGSSSETDLYDIVSSLNYDRVLLATDDGGDGSLMGNVGIRASVYSADSGVFRYDSETFGVASDAATDYDIYVYRGVLDDDLGGDENIYGSNGNSAYYPNYVKLGNTCWRIVRTTGSGGVKMIYNGLYYGGTIDGSCANASADSQVYADEFGQQGRSSVDDGWQKNVNRVGYTFSDDINITDSVVGVDADVVFGNNYNYSSVNTKDSEVKNYIENIWFNSLSGVGAYEDILEASAGYCNDRTAYFDAATSASVSAIVPYSTAGSVYFGAYGRNTNGGLPSLTCPNDRNVVDLYTTSDAANGNGQLAKPVALLTGDEASFAGLSSLTSDDRVEDNNNFLQSGESFWLLSPYARNGGHTEVGKVSGEGYLMSDSVGGVSLGVRPVVSLQHGIVPVSGSGTAANPWVVAEP